MDPEILELLMGLFQGVPQESSFNNKGQYQDSMDPLNDSLDTAQNLYSTLGFNIQDLILPPEPAAPWVNDVGEAYGQSPLYSILFADIEDGLDPITAVQNVMRAASPVDAAGNPLEPGDPNVARYVVQDEAGQLIDVPVKLWNNEDPVSGTTKSQVQLDLDALQGVAKDYAMSMAEGRRYTAEQPDYGTYTALDDIGGPEAVGALKVQYALNRGLLSQSQADGTARIAAGTDKDAANREMAMRYFYPQAGGKQGGSREPTQEPAGSAIARPGGGRAKADVTAPQGGNASFAVPEFLFNPLGGGEQSKRKPETRGKVSQQTREADRVQSRSYNRRMDEIIARSGNRVTRHGKDRQRQLDALKAVMALPQIMNGA